VFDSVTDGFVDAIMASPLGVVLLAALESRARNEPRWSVVRETSPATVAAAVDVVERMSFGDLVEIIVLTGYLSAGPWSSDAPSTVATSYRNAMARLPIAEAVDGRFGAALHAPIDRGAQQWWSDGSTWRWVDRIAPLFHDFEHVYGSGQFTWAGLWTVTDPPTEAHQDLIGAWELEQGPVDRWDLPVATDTRVFEVHRPADWARLVAEHPREGMPHPEWQLPGLNQHIHDVAPLLSVPGQRAVRTSVRRHLVPDWRAVAGEYEGVHLSWAGFLTAEGCITDLGDGEVTLLRYWFSERTLWLADVFGEPRPGTPVVLHDPATDRPFATPVQQSSAGERALVEQSLRRLLGR
jgi:hypothetical protein